MRAMILAAGRGERMRPLTDHTPKPLLTVAGKPLIQWHVEALAGAGIRDIVINLAWLGEQIRAHLGNGHRWGVNLHYSEEREALETGGGVVQALSALGEQPFLLLSADVWTDYPLERLRALPLEPDRAHFVMVPNPDFHPQGDFALADGRMALAGERCTYGNLGVFHPAFFAGCAPGRFALAPLMRRWVEQGRVSGERYDGTWHNLGTPQQLQALNAALQV